MASEAQRLIGISLTKIAQSRSHRGGASLHKNLLVATVLQKARYIFMEEAYNIVHHRSALVQSQVFSKINFHSDKYHNKGQQSNSCEDCTKNQQVNDTKQSIKLPSMPILRTSKLKRRHTIDERDVKDVQPNIPKRRRHKSESSGSSSDEESDRLCPVDLEDSGNTKSEHVYSSGSNMEIEAITTKLVSVISFMGSSENLSENLNNKLSPTELCSSRAKDMNDNMQCSVITITS